jgi:hypothetical protein
MHSSGIQAKKSDRMRTRYEGGWRKCRRNCINKDARNTYILTYTKTCLLHLIGRCKVLDAEEWTGLKGRKGHRRGTERVKDRADKMKGRKGQSRGTERKERQSRGTTMKEKAE